MLGKRLLLLAVVAIRQQGQKITADTKISLHADSYKEHFGVSRQVAYQALKMVVMVFLGVNTATKTSQSRAKEWFAVIGYHR